MSNFKGAPKVAVLPTDYPNLITIDLGVEVDMSDFVIIYNGTIVNSYFSVIMSYIFIDDFLLSYFNIYNYNFIKII